MNNTKKTKFEKWLDEANEVCRKQHEAQFDNLTYDPLFYTKGKNYVKIMRKSGAQTFVWAFVSMVDNPKKNERVGDLLKPASWKAPAKHARGNIFDGTAKYGQYGPVYMK